MAKPWRQAPEVCKGTCALGVRVNAHLSEQSPEPELAAATAKGTTQSARPGAVLVLAHRESSSSVQLQ